MSKHTLFLERTRNSVAPTPTASVRFPDEPRLRGGGVPRRHAAPPIFDHTHREAIAAGGKGEDS